MRCPRADEAALGFDRSGHYAGGRGSDVPRLAESGPAPPLLAVRQHRAAPTVVTIAATSQRVQIAVRCGMMNSPQTGTAPQEVRTFRFAVASKTLSYTSAPRTAAPRFAKQTR